MTFEEFKPIVKGLRAVYTSDRFLPDGDSVRIWFSMLSDLSYAQVSAAAQKYMLTAKFPPTIAEIREQATEITVGKLPDWGEAWAEWLNCVRRWGVHQEAKGMESLSPLTRAVVERLGYKNLCMSENEMADRANFRQCFETIAKRQAEHSVLPEGLRETIAQLGQRMDMAQIGAWHEK